MNTTLQKGLRTGTIFGLIILFLYMIGFTTIMSALLGDFLDLKGPSVGAGSVPGLVVLIGLIGLWAGAVASQSGDLSEDTWLKALVGGLAAGVISGLILALLAVVLNSLEDVARIRQYLVQISPQTINLFLLGRETGMAVAPLYLALMTASGLLGAALSRLLGRGRLRTAIASRRDAAEKALFSIPFLKKEEGRRILRLSIFAVLLALLFLMPQRLGQYWNFTLGTVGIYVLMGLGLNIVVGLAGLLDLGYVAFFAVGAYTIGLLTAPQPHGIMWDFWAVLPLGIVIASIAGILLGIPVLRLRGDYLAIVTLGFGEIIRVLARSDLLASFAGGPQGIRNIGGPSLFGNPLNSERAFMYFIIISIILVIFITTRLERSSVGRAWIAMREDETVAQAMGINTYRAKLLAFAIGAAFAGLGGVLFASRNQYTSPEDHSLLVSINVLALVIVGGMGSIPGVILGALALKGLPEMLRQLEDYRILAFGALLVVMMILRPEGLWPSTRRKIEIHTVEEELPPEPVHPRSTDQPVTTRLDTASDVTISTDVREA